MKVNHEITKKVVQGIATTTNNISISYTPTQNDSVKLDMYKKDAPTDHQVYCDAESARELAEFYTNLAKILEY